MVEKIQTWHEDTEGKAVDPYTIVEFWASAYVHNRSVRFKMNNKKHIIEGLEQIREHSLRWKSNLPDESETRYLQTPPLEKGDAHTSSYLGHIWRSKETHQTLTSLSRSNLGGVSTNKRTMIMHNFLSSVGDYSFYKIENKSMKRAVAMTILTRSQLKTSATQNPTKEYILWLRNNSSNGQKVQEKELIQYAIPKLRLPLPPRKRKSRKRKQKTTERENISEGRFDMSYSKTQISHKKKSVKKLISSKLVDSGARIEGIGVTPKGFPDAPE
ncbi:hypothetical protein Tco_0154127 [Tanacetum coccineum]